MSERSQYQNNKEYYRRYWREHSEEHKRNVKLYKERIKADPARLQVYLDKQRAWSKEYRAKVKYRVLSLYSRGEPKCAQCGELRIACLSIDHIQGDGAEHKKLIGGKTGTQFYLYIEENYDPDRYQVLCMNCQWIKREENRETR